MAAITRRHQRQHRLAARMGQHGRHDARTGAVDHGCGLVPLPAQVSDGGLAQLFTEQARADPFLAIDAQILRRGRVKPQVAGADRYPVDAFARHEPSRHAPCLRQTAHFVGRAAQQGPRA